MKGFIFPGFPVLSALIYAIIRDDLTDYEKEIMMRWLRKRVKAGNRDDMIALIYLDPGAVRMDEIIEQQLRSAETVADIRQGNANKHTDDECTWAEDFWHKYKCAVEHRRWERGSPARSRSWPDCIIWEIFVRSLIELWEIEEIPEDKRQNANLPKGDRFAKRIEEIARRTIRRAAVGRTVTKKINEVVKPPTNDEKNERVREIKDNMISEVMGKPTLGRGTSRRKHYGEAFAWTRHIFGYGENWMRRRFEGEGEKVYRIARKHIEGFIEKRGPLSKIEQTEKDGLFKDILDKVLFGVEKTSCRLGPPCHYDGRLRDFPTGPHNPLMPVGATRCHLVKDHRPKGGAPSGGAPVLGRGFYWLT